MKTTLTNNYDYMTLRMTDSNKGKVNLTLSHSGMKASASGPVTSVEMKSIWAAFQAVVKGMEAKKTEFTNYGEMFKALVKEGESASDYADMTARMLLLVK